MLFKPNIERMKEKKDVNGLKKALKHKDYRIRMKAAEALGEIGVKDAIDSLIKALKEDESSEVRKYAAMALGKIGDERAAEALIEALKDESLDVRLESAKALKSIGVKKFAEITKTLKLSNALKMFEGIRLKK